MKIVLGFLLYSLIFYTKKSLMFRHDFCAKEHEEDEDSLYDDEPQESTCEPTFKYNKFR